jgi:flavin-dependent dehydrogenase
MKRCKKLLVVGGGTAGLIAAMVLKKRLDIQIDVVRSKNIGIIGVGEGSTEHFKDFADFVGLNIYEIIKKCDATYKSGIMFDGWSNDPYLHSVASQFNLKFGQYRAGYAHQIANNSNYFAYNFIWRNQLPTQSLLEPREFYINQFHFNTYKLNEFLTDKSESIGITFYDDEILEVDLSENGEISFLKGKKQNYEYDFYIDSTGFKRILMEKLGARWQSYKKYLKMDSAVTFPTNDNDEFNLWTLAKTMDSGWLFRIPVWERYGNGYIFSSEYCDEAQAKKEVDKLFNRDIEIGKKFTFDPGKLDRVWIKNCCAIGLSGSFVEPLEATSIGTSIQQSFLLMHKLANYNEFSINEYNNSFDKIMDNIRDFIVLHYITEKNNSVFWKDIQRIELPDALRLKLARWRYRLPIDEDFDNDSKYSLFGASNYILVMNGLGLFDSDQINNEFIMQHQNVQFETQRVFQENQRYEQNIKTISHKKFIELIRELF